jgi:chromate transport protein ChrA
MTKQEFQTVINELGIEQPKIVLDEWLWARNHYITRKHSWRTYFRGIMMGLLPSIALILIFAVSRFRKNSLLLSTAIFYLIYIVPYILVSHQLRYQRPLMVIHVILIYLLYLLIVKKVGSKSNRIDLVFTNRS